MNPPGGTGSLSLHHRGNKTNKFVCIFSLQKMITNKDHSFSYHSVKEIDAFNSFGVMDLK